MRICLVCDSHPANCWDHSLALLRHLRRAGHSVRMLRRGGSAATPSASGAINDCMSLPTWVPTWLAVRQLRRRWRRQMPDVVHCESQGRIGRIALRAARSLGIVTSAALPVFTSHAARSAGVDLWLPTTPLQMQLTGLSATSGAAELPNARAVAPDIEPALQDFERQLRRLVADKALQRLNRTVLLADREAPQFEQTEPDPLQAPQVSSRRSRADAEPAFQPVNR